MTTRYPPYNDSRARALESKAGINQYNSVYTSQKMHDDKLTRSTQASAFPIDPLKYCNLNPSNILPQTMPLFAVGDAQNYHPLNNFPTVNPNYDLQAQLRVINPYRSVYEEYPSVSYVKVGQASTRLALGPVFV